MFLAPQCAVPCRYARKHFPSTRYLDYAITVEEYTLQKVGRRGYGVVCEVCSDGGWVWVGGWRAARHMGVGACPAAAVPGTRWTLTAPCCLGGACWARAQAANLVLNVDGCIGALFLDLLNSGGRLGGCFRGGWNLRRCPAFFAVACLSGLDQGHDRYTARAPNRLPSAPTSPAAASLLLTHTARRCPAPLPAAPLPAVGMFSPAEVQEVVDIGYLNGLFVLARSIGFIGGCGSRGWCLAMGCAVRVVVVWGLRSRGAGRTVQVLGQGRGRKGGWWMVKAPPCQRSLLAPALRTPAFALLTVQWPVLPASACPARRPRPGPEAPAAAAVPLPLVSACPRQCSASRRQACPGLRLGALSLPAALTRVSCWNGACRRDEVLYTK